jgi:hypothetical protein
MRDCITLVFFVVFVPNNILCLVLCTFFFFHVQYTVVKLGGIVSGLGGEIFHFVLASTVYTKFKPRPLPQLKFIIYVAGERCLVTARSGLKLARTSWQEAARAVLRLVRTS